MLEEDITILDFIDMAHFDGVTHYNFVDFAEMNRTYTDILEDVKVEWDSVNKSISVPLYPNVSLGWDNRLRYVEKKRKWICLDNTPENVIKGLELAKDYVDTHKENPAPLVVINSWNEWTEGSYVQPDDLNGYGFLEAVKKVFLTENK